MLGLLRFLHLGSFPTYVEVVTNVTSINQSVIGPFFLCTAAAPLIEGSLIAPNGWRTALRVAKPSCSIQPYNVITYPASRASALSNIPSLLSPCPPNGFSYGDTPENCGYLLLVEPSADMHIR